MTAQAEHGRAAHTESCSDVKDTLVAHCMRIDNHTAMFDEVMKMLRTIVA